MEGDQSTTESVGYVRIGQPDAEWLIRSCSGYEDWRRTGESATERSKDARPALPDGGESALEESPY